MHSGSKFIKWQTKWLHVPNTTFQSWLNVSGGKKFKHYIFQPIITDAASCMTIKDQYFAGEHTQEGVKLANTMKLRIVAKAAP